MKPSPYRRFRVRHHVSAAAGDENQLPKPTIDPTAFADVPEEFKDQKFLKAGVKASPLVVTFPIAIGFGEDDIVDLLLDGVSIFEKQRSISPNESGAGMVAIEIPSDLRQAEKEYIVTYRFKGEFDTAFENISPPASFRTKYTPAGDPPDGAHLGPLAFVDASILTTGLNSAKLTEMGDVLRAFVPSYKGSTDGDLIRPQVELLNVNTTVLAAPVRVPIGGTGGDIQVEFTRANLEEVGDGVAVFRYLVEDLAGNTSLLSNAVRVTLSVNSTSIVLDPPIVPVFDRDGIIDEATARPGVDVEIPGNAGLKTGDILYLSWGTQKLDGVPIIAVGATPIMTLTVPYGDILKEGTGTIQVTYLVYRAGEEIGAPENPTEVKVNVDQPGGKDPDPDTPENEALAAPTVHEAGWVTGHEENIITLENSDKDAHFIVQWYNTLTPQGEAFIEGDVLEFFYNGESFQTYTVKKSDVNSKANIDVVLPATRIKQSGSGTFAAYYLASRTVADGISNSARSPDQSVTVESAGDLPGGGEPLDLAIFADENLNTAVLDKGGAKVTVPMYKNMKLGDTVSIQFTANWRFSGLGPDIERAAYNEDKEVRQGYVEDREVVFYIPSEKIAYLYQTALGHLTYTAKNEHGSVTSPTKNIICDTRSQNGNAPDDPDRPYPPIIK